MRRRTMPCRTCDVRGRSEDGARTASSTKEECSLIEIKHQKQRYSWDCGVACVTMVLDAGARTDLVNNLNHISREEGFLRSTWTIDLCYLLRRYRVQHMYCTVTMGVHPGYRGHSFYSSIVARDSERVARRFLDAESSGLDVRCKRTTLEDVLKHMREKRGPIILLTNSRLLSCERCKINRLSLELRQCLRWSPAYQGHYILLCGYCPVTGHIFYRNPSLHDHVCIMPYKQLEHARHAYGTDDDIIFVHQPHVR